MTAEPPVTLTAAVHVTVAAGARRLGCNYTHCRVDPPDVKSWYIGWGQTAMVAAAAAAANTRTQMQCIQTVKTADGMLLMH